MVERDENGRSRAQKGLIGLRLPLFFQMYPQKPSVQQDVRGRLDGARMGVCSVLAQIFVFNLYFAQKSIDSVQS
jgi:hypothetical protein